MKQGVFFKNFLFTACMFAVCFIAFGLSMLGMSRVFLVREQEKLLGSTVEEAALLADAVQVQGELNSLELRVMLAAMSQTNGTHIFICDRDGLVVTSSDTARVSPYIGRRLSRNIMQSLRSQDGFQTIGDLDGFYEQSHNVVAKPIDAEGSSYVFATSEAGGFLKAWSGFIVMYILIALGVLAITLCFQYAYSRRLSRHLTEMAAAARRFGRGDYSARIRAYNEPDEIGTLTESFNAMAESLSRNEERRSEFVANVSHELRTPMTTIAGFADGLLDGTIPESEERKYLEKISSETKRLSRLVRTMLDMSRLQGADPAARMTRFDLTEMVVQTVLSFEPRVTRKRLDMVLNMPEEGLFVRGDVDALTRVVYNLADNAVKFAPEGTELTISVWKQNGLAYTSVQNRGDTIPREELPLIFDRFHKSDRSRSKDREGVGLGLYMVKAIIAAHQQNIFVTSENGVTAFTFTLALAEEEKTAAGEKKS